MRMPKIVATRMASTTAWVQRPLMVKGSTENSSPKAMILRAGCMSLTARMDASRQWRGHPPAPLEPVPPAAGCGTRLVRRGGPVRAGGGCPAILLNPVKREASAHEPAARPARLDDVEIGRASCRERAERAVGWVAGQRRWGV